MVSLDVFRGVTIAGTIVVNNPGSWSHVYPPLAHAEWHGWTPTDLIFPFFLFIMGVAIPLALGRRLVRREEWFPINKNLWTSSYAVFTAGMALLVLAVCFWAVEVKGARRPFIPFIILGTNPITVFVLSGLVARAMTLSTLARPDGTSISLKAYLYETLFASWAGPWKGSLVFALAYLGFWLAPMALLYRRRIFLTI